MNDEDDDDTLTDAEAKAILASVATKVKQAQADRVLRVELERYEAYLACGLAGHMLDLIQNVVHGDCDVITIRGVHFVRAPNPMEGP